MDLDAWLAAFKQHVGDAQYKFLDKYSSHAGWRHMSVEEAEKLLLEAKTPLEQLTRYKHLRSLCSKQSSNA